MKFSEEEIRRSLLTLAKNGGNSCSTAIELHGQGITISDRTLRDWKTTKYPDLYRQLHETYGREIEAALIPEFREVVRAGAEASHMAINQTVEQMNAGQLRDPASAARNLIVTAATAMDKLYLATDRPTVLTEHRNADEILRALEAKLGIHAGQLQSPAPVPVIDSTAEDAEPDSYPPPSNPPRGG